MEMKQQVVMNNIRNKKTELIHLGTIDFQQAWDYQTQLFQQILSIKTANRAQQEETPTPNYLIFCQHPPVYTLGKSGKMENLLLTNEEMETLGASFYHINRGGDITFHGPGQIVVYPILDLENFFTDIHRYMRTLEEAVIATCEDLGISCGRIEGMTGVWVDHEKPEARKICALGVKTSRWVTMHGLAFNVNTDLSFFQKIIPCGIPDKSVTSIAHEIGQPADLVSIEHVLKTHLMNNFQMEFI